MKKQVFCGKLLKVFVERKTMPHGFTFNLEYIRHPGAVAIVPFLSRSEILLIRQYRPAIGKYILEVPAGTLDRKESLSACAKREMIEETGYSAGVLARLGAIYTTPGFTTEKIHIFKAGRLKYVGRVHQKDELITIVKMPVKSLPLKVRRGLIVDSKTIAALAMSGLI
jgi:ADP-ribose pyrophosphatase